ncbi:hypothetical protein K1X12_13405 [Hyphomonas sp. WL0036]|uniref:hypothetical protein n=1 Tax=Hyphomonas sediminis TaxID=2866160 RepID=UPI001C8158F4|nr:hypothetical protein [Hyphomonas sediminis]MBY9067901.1 hypothetical protein [Hyphomonas sediminis]
MSVWDNINADDLLQRQINWKPAGASLGFVAGTLLILALFHNVLPKFYPNWVPGNWRLYMPLAAAIVFALALVRTRYSSLTAIMAACLRASAVGLTVLLIVERPDYTLAQVENAAREVAYVNTAYFLALALSLVAWFRPSFIVPTAIYLISTRMLVTQISGLEMSFLDIRYMLDMALYLGVFGLMAVTVGPRIHPWLGHTDRQNEIVGVVFGLHLANYFWSGFAKVVAGPTPWYWIFENQTYNQIPYTIESGILPIGHIPWLTELAYQVFRFVHVPMNLVIVVAQLFAIVCVFRVSWLKVASVMYELLHIGIYVLGGLFFWPWVWNNITVWWAARTSKEGLSWRTKLACVATIFLGAPALHLNEAAFLAWFDVADARQVYFEAVTEDGRAVKVPSAFFNSHSYSMSHAYFGSQAVEGQYDHTMLASSDSVERNEADGRCISPSSLTDRLPLETEEARLARQERMRRFIVAHHEKMLAREDAFGKGSYYFHVHHHPSNPFLYPEFNALSLHDVVGYQQVIESSCHKLVKGHVEKRVLARDTEYVDVR